MDLWPSSEGEAKVSHSLAVKVVAIIRLKWSVKSIRYVNLTDCIYGDNF